MNVLIFTCAIVLIAFVSAQKNQRSCPDGGVKVQGVCKTCPAGQGYESLLGCLTCASGFFKAKVGLGPCLPCPTGTSSRPGETKCTKCPKGTVLLAGKRCGQCPPGTYYASLLGYCDKCYKGTFQPYKNIEQDCFVCSEGTAGRGATKCITCPPGQKLMKNGKCGSCPAGSYFNEFDKVCQKCRPGLFQPESSVQTSCAQCPGNSFSRLGALSCTKCPFGTVLLKDGKCRSCPGGTEYNPFDLTCDKCYFNKYSRGSGVLQRCTQCPDFLYAHPGASVCFACPLFTQGLVRQGKTAKCRQCPKNSRYSKYSAECNKCPVGPSTGFVADECEECLGDTC